MTFWAYVWVFVPPLALVAIGLIFFFVTRPGKDPKGER
jgi:hypothetical protein